MTTEGYEQTLQVARSFCPGGLGGWVTFNKNPLLAPLELTIGASERIDADGTVSKELDEGKLREDLQKLYATGEVEALTICFVNAYINGDNEQKAEAIARGSLRRHANFGVQRSRSGDAGVRAHRNNGDELICAA